MSDAIYGGPIIDAHFHLWRYDPARYPWLAPVKPDNGLSPLRKDYLPRDYADLARQNDIVASVHIEANWNPENPVAETEWLHDLDVADSVADRLIAHAPLAEQRAEAILEQQASFESVAGIRDIMVWHPDAAQSRITDRDRMNNPVWRRNFSCLAALDLNFEMLISPWQAEDAFRVATNFPDTQIVIGHCGAPIDRDADGMMRWRQGLHRLADAPNIVLKISDPVAFDTNWSLESLRTVVLECIDAFGPQRVMFGSDHPVANLHIGFSQWIDVFKIITRNFSEDEKAAIFEHTARRIYWSR